ncbi:VC0807 family protein [Mycolicibacterium hodleri]|uniref:VC0807 family protein n=1 Tax=Mycolicibacterium hodleri TaxID=49897 RepID=UPI0011277D2B|nr:VC0807 family protein [Mycolicibacterium hodleri]
MTDPDQVGHRSMRPVLQTVLLDVAPPLVAYYGLRAAGASEYVALLSATLLSGVRVAYGVVKSRQLDPFAAYLLLTFGLSLAVGLATTDPKLILVGNTLVNGIGGLIFLGSCVIGTPLTQVVGDRFRKPGDVAGDDLEADSTRTRRIHVQLSAMWGIGLLVEVAIRLVVIANLSVDAANGVNSAITLPVIGLLVLATIVVGRRSSAPAAGTA